MVYWRRGKVEVERKERKRKTENEEKRGERKGRDKQETLVMKKKGASCSQFSLFPILFRIQQKHKVTTPRLRFFLLFACFLSYSSLMLSFDSSSHTCSLNTFICIKVAQL